MGKKWLPLESNPEVMTDFASRIGLDASRFVFHDVFGLDEELLAMVPQPVLAVLLLFPVTKEQDETNKAADEAAAAASGSAPPPADLYFMKQTIGNACGTIAMLHAFGNNLGSLEPAEGTFLRQFFADTRGLDAAARGAYLEQPPDGAPDIEKAHQDAGEKGDTAPPDPATDVDLHFVCFVCHEGQLYELDGRRAAPVCHGASSPDSLLADGARAAQQLMARTSSLNFNLIALGPAEG